MLFCHITSRLEGAVDPELLTEKGGEGFPYVIEMDADGNKIAESEWPLDVAHFETMMGKGDEYFALKKKADGGDKASKTDLLIRRMELGHLKFDEATKAVKALSKPTDEQKKKLDALLVDAEVKNVLSALAGGHDDQKAMDVGKQLLEMKKAGRIPTSEKMMQPFWIVMMRYAEKEKDAATFEEGYNALQAKFGDNPNAKGFFEKQKAILDSLKGVGSEDAGTPKDGDSGEEKKDGDDEGGKEEAPEGK